jgi:hypothetical protein
MTGAGKGVETAAADTIPKEKRTVTGRTDLHRRIRKIAFCQNGIKTVFAD